MCICNDCIIVSIQLQPSSEKLFNDFVDPVLSVQEVNLDDKYRKDLEAQLKSPSKNMFNEAQHQVTMSYHKYYKTTIIITKLS